MSSLFLQGSPVADLLKWAHCTVTVCHSKTEDLAAEVSDAWNDEIVIPLDSISSFVGAGFSSNLFLRQSDPYFDVHNFEMLIV